MPGRVGKMGREENGESEIRRRKEHLQMICRIQHIKIMIAMSAKRLSVIMRYTHFTLQTMTATTNLLRSKDNKIS